MQGYLINAADRTITPATYKYTGTATISQRIGCDCFCIAWTWPNGDVCYVDDEGLFKPQTHFFTLRSRPDAQPLAGNGFVTGPDNDKATDPPRHSLVELEAEILWLRSHRL